MPFQRKSAWEIAEDWYRVEHIENYLLRQKQGILMATETHVPTDVFSRQFAEWLTLQYRLAMAKGIQLARE